MRENSAFEFGFGKVHVGCQTQKLRHHRILDELQLILLIRRGQRFHFRYDLFLFQGLKQTMVILRRYITVECANTPHLLRCLIQIPHAGRIVRNP